MQSAIIHAVFIDMHTHTHTLKWSRLRKMGRSRHAELGATSYSANLWCKARALRIRALCIRALRIRALRIRALRIRALRIRALRIRALRIRANTLG